MNQNEIFGPMFAMFLLTLVVWIVMYARRIPFITSNNLTAQQLTPVEFARLSPPRVANASDNLKNLFEIPCLFYALLLYLFVTTSVDQVTLIGAWLFVLFRVIHSVVHCTVNLVPLRFAMYATATMVFWIMVVRSAYLWATS